MKITTLDQAEKYLLNQVSTGSKQMQDGALWINRSKYFYQLLDNPQNRLKVIHVAGTSGKGSTSYLISHMLKNLGFKVGLALSPHILDIRERVQINNELISKEKFVYYLNKLLPYIKKTAESEFGSPKYFEIMIAIAFLAFTDEKVDYAVIETGLGGKYDATNTVQTLDKVVVLTPISFDHTKILGKTIKSIAQQKAGIIHRKNLVISSWHVKSARKVIEDVCKENSASLTYLKAGLNFKNVYTSDLYTKFDFEFKDWAIFQIKLGLLGAYQVQNCSLALAAVALLAQKDKFPPDIVKIKNSLETASFMGRFDIKKLGSKMLVFDCAHNPQKMFSFISSLKDIYPGQKFDFLIAFKNDKDYKKMLKTIIPVANKIFISGFSPNTQEFSPISLPVTDIAKSLDKLGFGNYQIVDQVKKPLEKILHLSTCFLVITGSIYFLSEVYAELKNPEIVIKDPVDV